MSFESLLRTDILDDEITTEQKRVRVIAETQFMTIVNNATVINNKTTTPNPSKNIIEAMDLIKSAVESYELREHASKDAKINITYAYPDTNIDLETISICLEERSPGMHSQGSPSRRGAVKNLRPLLRETIEDPSNPGYKRAILGYFYDNTLSLTCWARTNKAANDRALWLENVMEEYTWFFAISGVNRVLYQGRGREIVREVGNNKLYGRPIDYFIRTEKLRVVSQKKLEEIIVYMAL